MADVVTYARNREDLYIAGFFPDVENGFYVDVGARHPVWDSVTKYFSLRGWTGINIEPQRKYHELLAVDRVKDVNLNIGISDALGTLRLREFPGDVKVETLANVLAEHVPEGQTLHFLKVDVQGLEYEVFRGNDWSRFRPILLCVEAHRIVKNWHQLLADANYEKVLFDGMNEYFLAKEHMARLELFAFADMFLADKQIRPFFLSSQIEDLHGQVRDLLTEAAELNSRHAQALTSQAEANRQLLYWRSVAIRSWGSAMVGRRSGVGALKRAISVLKGKAPRQIKAPLRKVRRAQRTLTRRARTSRVATLLRKVRNATTRPGKA